MLIRRPITVSIRLFRAVVCPLLPSLARTVGYYVCRTRPASLHVYAVLIKNSGLSHDEYKEASELYGVDDKGVR